MFFALGVAGEAGLSHGGGGACCLFLAREYVEAPASRGFEPRRVFRHYGDACPLSFESGSGLLTSFQAFVDNNGTIREIIAQKAVHGLIVRIVMMEPAVDGEVLVFRTYNDTLHDRPSSVFQGEGHRYIDGAYDNSGSYKK